MSDYEAAAAAAQDRYGVRVVELREASLHHTAAELLRRIWRADSADAVMNAALMTALAHAGNYVAGAYRGAHLVGAAVGFFGVGHLHSHVTGVAPGGQGRGVGYAIKQHQRAWTLARGITTMRWTCDPLVGRNVYFNLHKLGASATAYLPDFYGPLEDGINTGDASDRLYITWELETAAAVDAADGRPVEVDAAKIRADGAAVLVDRDDAGGPIAAQARFAGPSLLVAGPRDVEELRGRDPEAASRWRYAVRDALVGSLSAGYLIAGISRDGYYALERM